MGHTITTRKNGNNFWQQKLIDRGISLREMADMLGCSYKYTVAYFSGFVHPNEKMIADICDRLEVPVELGKQKFAEIYDAWGVAHKDTYVKYNNTYKRIDKLKGVVDHKIDAHNKPICKARTNFWHHKISGKCLSLQEIADYLCKPYPTTKAYFTGEIMPDDDVIIALCKKLNVDFSRAYQEFVKIHTFYEQKHNQIVAEPSKEVIKVIDNHIKIPSISDCLRRVYDELSYEDFMHTTTLTTSYEDMLRFIYQKVAYSTFISLLP